MIKINAFTITFWLFLIMDNMTRSWVIHFSLIIKHMVPSLYALISCGLASSRCYSAFSQFFALLLLLGFMVKPNALPAQPTGSEYIIYDFLEPKCNDNGDLEISFNFFGKDLLPEFANPTCSLESFYNPEFESYDQLGLAVTYNIHDHTTGEWLMQVGLQLDGRVIYNSGNSLVWSLGCEGLAVTEVEEATNDYITTFTGCSNITIEPGNAAEGNYPLPPNTEGITKVTFTIPYGDPFYTPMFENATGIDVWGVGSVGPYGFSPESECQTATNLLFNGLLANSYPAGTIYITEMPAGNLPQDGNYYLVQDFQWGACVPAPPLDCTSGCGGNVAITYEPGDGPNNVKFHFDANLCPGVNIHQSHWKFGDGTTGYTSTPFYSPCSGVYGVVPHPSDGYICHTYPGPGTYVVKVEFVLYNPKTFRFCTANTTITVVIGPDGFVVGGRQNLNGFDSLTPNDNVSMLSLQPNPVSTNMLVKYLADEDEAVNAIIVDMEGRQVLEQRLLVQKGENSFEFDLGQLPSGIYMLYGFDRVKQFVKH